MARFRAVCFYVYFVLSETFTETWSAKGTFDSIADVSMPGVRTTAADQYMCTTVKVKEPGYIVRFLPTASADRVHHMLLFGCDEPPLPEGVAWECAHGSHCNGKERIIYAWARNAPPLELPDEVGVEVGKEGDITNYVLQVHYALAFSGDVQDYSGVQLQLTKQRPQYLAAIYLFAAGGSGIPPHEKSYKMNMTCVFPATQPIWAFAYRTHAHNLGRIISAYKHKDDWTAIGKGNPLWPQMFYPIANPVKINPEDELAAQCIYSSYHIDHHTHIGMTGHNEMCNFYMYYYANATTMDSSIPSGCYGDSVTGLMNVYPKEASEPMPRNFLFEEAAKSGDLPFELASENSWRLPYYTASVQSTDKNPESASEYSGYHRVQRRFRRQYSGYGSQHQNYGPLYVNDRKKAGPGGYFGGYQGPQNPDLSQIDLQPIQINAADNTLVDSVPTSWQYRNNAPQQLNNNVPPFLNTDPNSAGVQAGNIGVPVAPNQNNNGRLSVDIDQPTMPASRRVFGVFESTNWPISDIQIGQVGGLAVDSRGNVWIFHRGSRVWDHTSFDEKHVYLNMADGPITENALVILNSSGAFVDQWGTNLFYLPHDIFIDSKDNVWITDVAMHQVLKFQSGARQASLILGEQFVPGLDRGHFCKPAGVVVTADGTIYVADGYCNGRIAVFASDGTYKTSWGQRYDGSGLLADGFPPIGRFQIVHSVSADEARGLLFVADRENGRIQVVSMKNGTFVTQIHPKAIGPTVYALKYCAEMDTLFVANGISQSMPTAPLRVFALNPVNYELMYSWGPKTDSFKRPHALAAGHDSQTIYVGEIGPNRVWRFSINAVPRKALETSTPAAISKSSSIVEVVTSTNPTELALIMGFAVALPILLAILICACIRFRKQGGFRTMKASYKNGNAYKGKNGTMPLLNGWSKSHNGFQPLNTEDIDGLDDLTDESENEDTLYPVAVHRPHEPLKA